MLFVLRAPDSKFRKDGLMLVNWPKHVDKIRIKNILLCLIEARNFLSSFSYIHLVRLDKYDAEISNVRRASS